MMQRVIENNCIVTGAGAHAATWLTVVYNKYVWALLCVAIMLQKVFAYVTL